MSGSATPRELRNLQIGKREPFTEWLQERDAPTRALIRMRLNRIKQGNFGNVEPVGEGVSELKVDAGPGYRVYFGQEGNTVFLISGGTKKRQSQDILEAKKLWRESA